MLYRVSQEERTKLREGVPYVKLYRYNPKYRIAISRSMRYTAVDVHYAEMQDVHTFLWPLSP